MKTLNAQVRAMIEVRLRRIEFALSEADVVLADFKQAEIQNGIDLEQAAFELGSGVRAFVREARSLAQKHQARRRS